MFESNSKPGRGESRIGARASQEASRASPAFSPALHARIMHAVASADRAPAITRRSARSAWVGASVISAGLAAAVTVMVSPLPGRLLLGTSSTIQNPTSAPIAAAGPIGSDKPILAIDEAARDMNVRVKDVLQTAMVTQHWAGLDHDVWLATQYFVDQVPLRSAWDGRDAAR
ncbi:MAG TPA: hypothetical protein VG326_18845 [Tepidisphaeraceae bacterium]|jgi:hypothetical protein|nr:hypothetical protein [Tepidisphaeraceae bacterium]